MSSPSPLPTDAELQVLRVLWERGPCTARQVHDDLYGSTDVGYTTALKLLQNMTNKKLVTRTKPSGQRHHLYRAAVERSSTLRNVVHRFADRAFKGSAARLAMHALDLERIRPEELEELERLLDRLRKQQGEA